MTIATAPCTAVGTQDNEPIILDVTNTRLTVASEQFDRLCLDNPNLRLELTPNRELIVMDLTGGESGKKNARLSSRVVVSNDETDLGEVFDSSTGYDFTEFGGGKRSPDVSWIEKSRLEGKNIIRLIQIVPDFATELRSPTDNLSEARTKMAEYQQLGVRLGLFINPQDRQYCSSSRIFQSKPSHLALQTSHEDDTKTACQDRQNMLSTSQKLQ